MTRCFACLLPPGSTYRPVLAALICQRALCNRLFLQYNLSIKPVGTQLISSWAGNTPFTVRRCAVSVCSADLAGSLEARSWQALSVTRACKGT